MRPNNLVWRLAAGIALAGLIAASAPADAAATTPADQVAELRQQAVAAAHDVQQREERVGALEHDIALRSQDADGRRRGLDDSRAEQAELLAALEIIALHPPERPNVAAASDLDRRRGEMLIAGTIPALRAEARALSAEFDRIAALRRRVASDQDELAGARQALDQSRQQVADLVAQRFEVIGKILPGGNGVDPNTAKPVQDPGDIAELIKRADATIDRYDQALLAKARAAIPKAYADALPAEAADPTRLHELHGVEPPEGKLAWPVAGEITRPFVANGPTPASQPLAIAAALPGALVVAPADGRVVFAGPLRDLGLVLIIRHGGLYHSLLAGLGRIDTRVGHWLLSGEPVGAMPEGAGAVLQFELRREGRPVDPQPWLATREEGRTKSDGDQKVRE